MKKCNANLTAVLIIILLAAFFVPVNAAYLVPVGKTSGIKLNSDGVVVIGFSEDRLSPAKMAGIKQGDIIESVNGVKIKNGKHFGEIISSAKSDVFDFGVSRLGKRVNLTVRADRTENGDYFFGTVLRDTLAGIGTITFLDPVSRNYGALGHGISDPDTMSLSGFPKGMLMPSKVISVKKGQPGEPGELLGSYDMSKQTGTVEKNTDGGIFGKLSSDFSANELSPVETASLAQVKKGKAYILSNVSSDKTEKFEIEICDIFGKSANMRQMLIKVTDPELIAKTGGIVQGMSGSPIIQDGKLIGAVTHVLINDPRKGYAIGIDTMLEKMSQKLAA